MTKLQLFELNGTETIQKHILEQLLLFSQQIFNLFVIKEENELQTFIKKLV